MNHKIITGETIPEWAAALNYLEADRLLHIDMIEPLRRGSAELLCTGENGVLVYDRSARLYLISAKTPEAAADMAAEMKEPVLAAAHQEYTAQIVAEMFGLRQTMCCRQTMWPVRQPPAVPAADIELRMLTAEAENEIFSLYSHDIGREYIRGRLLAGEMLGAFISGELAGFIGLHEEGSMGMLEVRPAYRRRGIASQLIAGLSAQQLSSGRIPFSQFVFTNEQSEALHRHLGFAISKEYVYWLEQ